MKEDHPDDVVARSVHPGEVHQRVESGRERPVQPSSPLANELGGAFGHICLSFGSLHVGQMPLAASLGYKLETQDTILGQEHVLLEDVHALDTLRTELL